MISEYGAQSNEERGRFKGTLKDVVDGGYCVGCGACAAVSGGTLGMGMTKFGTLEPDLANADPVDVASAKYEAICPSLSRGPHETELSQLYAKNEAIYDDRIGWYHNLYAGHAVIGKFRDKGSSGGLTSWLLNELMAEGHIDAAIEVRVRPSEGEGPLFEFRIATNQADVLASAKTRYYPIELSQVADLLRQVPGRYAFVGVPCFVKAMKRLAAQEQVIGERVVTTIAIICGHLKSTGFGESLAWQVGCQPSNIATVDFRLKLPGRPASRYGFCVTTNTGEVIASPMDKLAGHDWGLGMFRLKACDYCDDVVGEAADVSFGDAWLPQYANDSDGTNIVIVRDPRISAIFQAGMKRAAVDVESLSSKDVIRSQDASFRHRRDGLAYRLHLDDKNGAWRPWKRTQAAYRHLNSVQKAIFRFRSQVSKDSHLVFMEAKQSGNLKLYTDFVVACTVRNNTLKAKLRRHTKVIRLMQKILRRLALR